MSNDAVVIKPEGKLLDIDLVADANDDKDVVVSGTIMSRTAGLVIKNAVIDIFAEAAMKAARKFIAPEPLIDEVEEVIKIVETGHF